MRLDASSFYSDSKQFGVFYHDVIAKASGLSAKEPDVELLRTAEPYGLAHDMLHKQETFKQAQANVIVEKDMSAKDFLLQSARFKKHESLLNEHEGSLSLDMADDGVPIIKMPKALFRQVHNKSAGATCFRLSGDEQVSFVIAPLLKDTGSEKSQTTLETNTKHEVHHLLFQPLLHDAQNETSYNTATLKKAFLIYKDELIASAISDENFMATHRKESSQKRKLHQTTTPILRSNANC